VTIHQFSGVTRAIVGAFQLTIAVSTAQLMLAAEERKLAVLRHTALAIPAGDRWRPIFERYLAEIEARFRDLGGDPKRVQESPDGGTGDASPEDRVRPPWKDVLDALLPVGLRDRLRDRAGCGPLMFLAGFLLGLFIRDRRRAARS